MPKYHALSRDMFSWNPSRQKKLESVITGALQKWGRSVFAESQRRVPVVTGQLKASGSITLPDDGFEIIYSAPYAKKVELGDKTPWSTPGGTTTDSSPSEPVVMPVRAHIRRTNKGRVRVKAHTKTFVAGQRPMRFADGQIRTVWYSSMVSQGKHFLGGAMQSLLQSALLYNMGLQKYLQTDTI